MRAVAPAAVDLLQQLGVLRTGELSTLRAHRRPPVQNAAGLDVGWLEAHVTATATSGARA